ncbi:MAG: hypothetical protein Q7R76_05405 [Candidatus Woesearchaeota archaeon]|nr:hypothetical protein [Candidatus Woesearchaeota archaeon]
MFDFKQRVFTILAMVLLIGGMVVLTTNKDLTGTSSVYAAPSASPSVTSFTGYPIADRAGSVSVDELGKFGFYVLLLAGLVVGVFQLASFSSRLNDESDARRAVVAYIKQAREQGFSPDQIEKRLQDAGWGDESLEKSFNRVA